MSTYRHRVQGDEVKIIALPDFSAKATSVFREFWRNAPDGVLGLDVETTAIDPIRGAFDPDIEMRLIQFGDHSTAWALDPRHAGWRAEAEAALGSGVRFVAHNASFDATRVLHEFGIDLGIRVLDTLPVADLIHPGRTLPGGKGLKNLSSHYLDDGLREADEALGARFADLYYAQTVKLPKSFEPGVSRCRVSKCGEPSWEESACGYCAEHYRTRRVTKDIARWGWDNISTDDPTFLSYAGLDAIYVRRLKDVLDRAVEGTSMQRLATREQSIKRLMTSRSVRGLAVDLEWTGTAREETRERNEDAREAVRDLTGYTPTQYAKVKDWLNDAGLHCTSIAKDHLPELAKDAEGETAEVVGALMEFSASKNLLANLDIIFTQAEAFGGYVHPEFNTQQAHTGRFSVTKPALQTLAKKGEKGRLLRGCFVARPGHVLIGADYDSQETRIAAALSGDEAMLAVITEGLNMHEVTARGVFGEAYTSKAECPDMYANAKTLDFAQQYGAMPKKLAATMDVSLAEATAMWRGWRETYAGFVEWSEEKARHTRVTNPFGRVIPVGDRAYAAANFIIQSSGRDILGGALARLAKAGYGENVWIAVHDELILEVPEDSAEADAKMLGELMTTTLAGVEIPATGEVIGRRWRGLS